MIRALVFLSAAAALVASDDQFPKAVNVRHFGDHIDHVYRTSEEEEGTAPMSPVGVFVRSGEVHGSPHYSRQASFPGEQPMHLYRSSRGIWVMTESTSNFEQNRGTFITSKAGESPIGLKWRYFHNGKWPTDDQLGIEDHSQLHEEYLLRNGPPKLVIRTCPGGVGDAGSPGYKYTKSPATFPCMSNSPYCVHNSSVYCHFKADDVDAIIEALDEELHVLSASAVILEDELELLDGRGQTEALKKRVQAELFQASYRVYLMGPWFGMKTYIQVADAILLFSVCASYGVAAGIFFASAQAKKEQKEKAA